MSLIITGIIDGPLTGGLPKAVELTVLADIPDLSVWGLGSAFNGGASSGADFTLSGSATAGQRIYVASESVQFTTFFGFTPTFVSAAVNINGDDAIELFLNGAVVDTFGVVGVDGTGEPWEHLDGWAYRIDGTSASATFNLADWFFSGINALDGQTSNDTAAIPFPVGSFTPDTGGALPLVTIEATDAAASEAGQDVGTFRISRTGDTTEALVVSFTTGGTAAGGDFTPALTGTATIAAGQSFVDVTITPVDDAAVEAAETVTLTLTDAAAYDLGATVSATVTIADNDVAPPATIVINEIDSDTPGDDRAEFVELYDGGVGNVSLDGLVVVLFNGNGDTSYAAFDLDGFSTSADGFFVLGNVALPVFDLIIPGNSLQNGADAVALYRGNASDFPTGTAVTSANLVDAIVYDTNDADDTGLLNGLGETTQFDEAAGGDSAGQSLARNPDGTGSFVVQAPTPGGTNDLPPPITINELRVGLTGSPDLDFVELHTPVPATSLSGLSLVVLSGEFNPGQVDFAFDLGAGSFDANGFFLLGSSNLASTLFEAGDIRTTVEFFSSPATYLLVDGFTGSAGQDLDADNNGVLDSNIGTVIDGVSFIDGDAIADRNYAATVVGPDGSFTPGGAARATDGDGDYGQLAFLSTAADTPGFSNEVVAPVEITRIFTIQGAGHLSAFDGQAVTTEGIVTAVDSNGFYLQDATGDGNVNTSDGIFVFTSSAPTVSVGQSVRVAGTVDEFIPGGASTGNLATTEIVAPVVTVLSSGNALPTATEIGGLTGRQVPTQFIISPDEASNFGQINLNNPATVNTFDPAQDSIDFFESLEGMRVTVAQVQAVSGTNSFGEIFGVAAQATPTEFNANGGVTLTGTDILTADFNPERLQIQLDTGILPGGSLPNVNVGDTITGVTGVVSYNFGEFEINITAPVTVTPGDAAPEVTDLIGDRDTLVVAGYNVLNLDPNDAEAAGNQPDQDVAQGRFDLIAQQITVNLKLPDIIALQEVQDNNGGDFGGVTAANVTLQKLVDAIFAESGVRYSFVDNPFIAAETNGGQPGGNIRTAFLYNDARVDFNGVNAVTDPVAQQTDLANPFFDSRPPLAGDFSFNGQDITVVSVHNSSRGGSTPLSGAVQQPTLGGSEAARNAQSQAINDFVDARLATNPDSHIVTIGDFNGFSFERWSNLLEGDADGGTQVMTNLTNLSDDPQDDYSFIFNGNSQALDHTFVTQNLVDDVTLDRVHVNVDFAAAGGIRASDHDPEVVAIDLGVLVALNGRNRVNDVLVGTGANETINGLTGRDTYTGGRGNDVFVLGRARDFDIVTDFGNGADQLDVSSWGIDGFEDLSFVQRTNNVILVQDSFGHRGIISAFDGSIRATDFTADQFIFEQIA